MKVRSVKANNRARRLELTTARGTRHFPYAQLRPAPTAGNRLKTVFVDRELAREGVTYCLEDGTEQSVLLDEVLFFNQEPEFMRELLVRRASAIAAKLLEETPLSIRGVARLLGTNSAQIKRLADPNTTANHLENVLALLHVLDAEIEVRVTPRHGKPESISVPLPGEVVPT